eukprot:m.14510 g.14510  ORF g.14510 m.14510 type:complete len:67 (+) comp25774_c0_seq2:504-704(+)
MSGRLTKLHKGTHVGELFNVSDEVLTVLDCESDPGSASSDTSATHLDKKGADDMTRAEFEKMFSWE